MFTTLAKGRTIGEYWIGEQKQEKLSVTTYEDGAFSILRKRGDEEILQQYDASGLLVSSKYPSYLVEYRYNENRVLREERTIEAGGRMTSKKYEEGKLVESTEEAGGRVVQSTRYNEDGSSVQTLYTEGRRYADVTYAVDGKAGPFHHLLLKCGLFFSSAPGMLSPSRQSIGGPVSASP